MAILARGVGAGLPLDYRVDSARPPICLARGDVSGELHIYGRIPKRLDTTPGVCSLYNMATETHLEGVGTIQDPDIQGLGPAMLALTPRQRRFVVGVMLFGGLNHTKAAVASSDTVYASNSTARAIAYGLAHNPKILEAIREEGLKMLAGSSVMAIHTVLDIANDPTAEKKDRLKAVGMILNRVGMSEMTEHKVAVVHTDRTSGEMIKRIELLSKNLGLDSKKLLGNISEAEYVEVPSVAEDDLSDIY